MASRPSTSPRARTRSATFAGCLTLLLAIGCAQTSASLPGLSAPLSAEAADILTSPDAMEIYALHPSQSPAGSEDRVVLSPTFHGYPILGEAEVTKKEVRGEILELVERGVREHNGISALCFLPRHGVRVHKGGKSVDLVICYECFSMQIFDLAGEPVRAFTDSAVSERLTEIFAAHGLEIHTDEE